ncbi:AAA family ATPase [Euzebya sp.]|uniref:AAA family ATPase n=1 Tax=Euzebya sp. TaxID=1971409 RepID=UPI0035126F2B
MTLGVTVGKFNPFHVGHDHLLRTALARVDHLVVVLGDRPGETIPAATRAGWLRDEHPEVEVLVTLDDLPDAPEPWAQRTLDLLAGRRPDLAFTSEPYGDAWAAAMGARHVAVDPARAAFGVCGSALRADLGSGWRWLAPASKAGLARRVVVVGAESSGTTTLAEDLAAALGTVWVPEHGRWYWEGRRHLPDADRWDPEEFVHIGRAQAALEDALARRADRVLVADTDPLATVAWAERYLDGPAPDALVDLAAARRPDLYLLTAPDFGFVQDGTREDGPHRQRMHERLAALLAATGVPWHVLCGPPTARLAEARRLVEPLRAFAVLA